MCGAVGPQGVGLACKLPPHCPPPSPPPPQAPVGTEARPFYDFLESCLRHKSEMVIFEAARAICNMREVTTRELTPAVTVLQLFLSSSKPVLRFSAVRTLNKVGAVWVGGACGRAGGGGVHPSSCRAPGAPPPSRPSTTTSPAPPHPPTTNPPPPTHPPTRWR